MNEYSGSIFVNKIHLFDGIKQSIISKASDDDSHLEQTVSLWRSDTSFVTEWQCWKVSM